jgi:hypothetical protein
MGVVRRASASKRNGRKDKQPPRMTGGASCLETGRGDGGAGPLVPEHQPGGVFGPVLVLVLAATGLSPTLLYRTYCTQ